ncbi:unnamed protein product [Ostreobium quekettii]|uniref:protein-serine/threonine phosphatase n=1 Tax=Ostreobium quekettii TaxID=121088 RepID=A0A8S1IMI0_9CHLO|nr:unnamed protein product [Ostreobium quekettii]|eukprot:evm.model.scf_28.12 EVM.evm.TU.scf_28.12   scf_28:199737-202694(-)
MFRRHGVCPADREGGDRWLLDSLIVRKLLKPIRKGMRADKAGEAAGVPDLEADPLGTSGAFSSAMARGGSSRDGDSLQRADADQPVAAPPIGTVKSHGRRLEMEDDSTVKENLVWLPLLVGDGERVVPKMVERGLRPLWEEVGRRPSAGPQRTAVESSTEGAGEPRRVVAFFHFAGVYDGHGGEAVSKEAATYMHLFYKKAFAAALLGTMAGAVPCNSNLASSRDQPTSPLTEKGTRKPPLVQEAFEATGEVDEQTACALPPPTIPSDEEMAIAARRHPGLTLCQIADAIVEAFHLMDGRLKDQVMALEMGSTAVVAMVCESHMCIANCGDSRAVLSRGGAAYRLSRDHKPGVDDERERIRAAGGAVLDCGGRRVMGLLAVSRALGDHYLRTCGVVADPEVTIIGRNKGDEFLVLATDGLWDAFSDSEACDVTRKTLEAGEAAGKEAAEAAEDAAQALVDAALERGSRDNTTVTIVDLRCKGDPPQV